MQAEHGSARWPGGPHNQSAADTRSPTVGGPVTDAPPLTHGALMWGGLATATVLTLVFGLFPSVFEIVQHAAAAISTLPSGG